MNKMQTLLIVEDEELNRSILKHILKDHYLIIEAENGMVGWQILKEKKSEISLVLLDTVMPVMNGYDFLKNVREAHMEDIPIIVTTGAREEDAEHKALDEGAWDFVTKPYNAQVLISRLKNAIARSQVAAFEKMQYMSEHDELTGLYNRRMIFSEARKMIDAHPDSQFMFIRFDIDHFALFNTSFGEKEGDRLLQFLAEYVKETAEGQEYCTYGRMSSDIFCICSSYSGNLEGFHNRAELI